MVIILTGLCIGWIFYRRSINTVLPILKHLAVEYDGTVKSNIPFIMPKLFFSYAGKQVEVSSASTGIEGQSNLYTYVLFDGIDSKGFEFRILPMSVQTTVDNWIGIKDRISTSLEKLDDKLVIYTNNKCMIKDLMSEHVTNDLLRWAYTKNKNGISDIRNYEDKLIYAVDGTLDNYQSYKFLIDSACRFYDAYTNKLTKPEK